MDNAENKKESAEGESRKWKNRKRILPSVLISISIPLILCLAIPFEIYSTNMREFYFGIWDFLPLSIAFGVVLAAVILCVLLFVPERLYKIFSLIVLAFALLLFLQGNYLNAGVNSLAGDNLGTGTTSIASKIINLFIWLVIIGGAVGVSFIKDKKGIIGIISLVLAIIIIVAHLVIPVFAVINNNDVFMSKNDKLTSGDGTKVAKFVSTKNLTTISSTNNVFYFVIDRFDEYYAEEVPELFETLDGFTHFRDNISLYGHTFPAVAHMLTDYRYDISLSREGNLKKAYEDNTTLKTLHENGYKINIYGQSYYDYAGAGNLPDYVDNVSEVHECKVNNPFLLSLYMIGLGVYRCSPHLMKPLYVKVNSDSCNSFVDLKDIDGYANYSSNNKEVLSLVKDTPFKKIEEKVFTFIHFDGCHNVNFDCKNGTVHPSSKSVKKIRQSVEDCLETIKLYIDELKDNGVYENATIIITGDHGISGKDDNSKLSSSRLTALFVKPSKSGGGELKLSDAQVVHENIWPTIMQSENIRTEQNSAPSLFDIDETVTVDREYIWHTYNRYSLNEYHYTITGSGRNFDNWKIVETVHADKYLMD